MILLEDSNRIIAETIQYRLEKLSFCLMFSTEDKPESLDISLADFDQVTYHITTPDAENKNILRLSMNMRCYSNDLVKYGAEDVLKREYGSFLTTPEEGYQVSLLLDPSKIPAEERDATIKKIASLKTNAMAAPFEKAFQSQKESGGKGEWMSITYREEENIYIQSAGDRVTVIFSTLFKDETDKIFGKVFLQEFVDCRKQPALQNAPQVLYTNREPPIELRGLPGVKESDNVGYVTFVLFPRHYANPQKTRETISLIQYFRDYLHYHIKCSKAYMHSRMRGKVESWMKVLNRAKPETEEKKDKKLASGKTFTRK